MHTHTWAHHKRTTSTWRQPPPISHGWLVLCRLCVNSWNIRTHTNTNTHNTCAKDRKTGHGLKNVPLRLLDQFPYLPGFCNWPHSALSSSLCTWLRELYKLMTANQTQMAVLMLLLLQLVLHVCVRGRVWHIKALLRIMRKNFTFICCIFYAHNNIWNM